MVFGPVEAIDHSNYPLFSSNKAGTLRQSSGTKLALHFLRDSIPLLPPLSFTYKTLSSIISPPFISGIFDALAYSE